MAEASAYGFDGDVGGRLTGLGNAFAHYGRIFKTLHLLQVIHVEAYWRMIGTQLNIGESRHTLARRVFLGNLGRLVRGRHLGHLRRAGIQVDQAVSGRGYLGTGLAEF